MDIGSKFQGYEMCGLRRYSIPQLLAIVARRTRRGWKLCMRMIPRENTDTKSNRSERGVVAPNHKLLISLRSCLSLSLSLSPSITLPGYTLPCSPTMTNSLLLAKKETNINSTSSSTMDKIRTQRARTESPCCPKAQDLTVLGLFPFC